MLPFVSSPEISDDAPTAVVQRMVKLSAPLPGSALSWMISVYWHTLPSSSVHGPLNVAVLPETENELTEPLEANNHVRIAVLFIVEANLTAGRATCLTRRSEVSRMAVATVHLAFTFSVVLLWTGVLGPA